MYAYDRPEQVSDMSKITFRADDDLIERVEALDASKSEIMREALRAHLEEHGGRDAAARSSRNGESLDALLVERIDELVRDRLDGRVAGGRDDRARDVNVTVSLEGAASETVPAAGPAREPTAERQESSENRARPNGNDSKSCAQCGESIDGGHVYCPNCGEKASRRVFCDCGDEIRSDWAFCPGCGRRTPSADVLDGS